jgi:hypothetical protein
MSKTKVLLKFADDNNFYKCEVQRMSEHMIKVIGLIQDLSGFQLYSDSKELIGDYSTYVYEYDNPNLGENIFEYTDNGAVYPSEGADKSLEESIMEKVKNYADTQSQILQTNFSKTLDKTKDAINEVMSEDKNVSLSQFNELQDTVIDIYSTMQEILVTLNSGKDKE